MKRAFGRNARVAVLNFANAFHCGGGVTGGARAQEECLCRCSTLYPVLKAVERRGRFYQKHAQEIKADPQVTDQKGILYSPGIMILKDDDYGLLEEKVPVDVITAAAPETFRLASITAEELREIFHAKIRTILHAAILHHCDAAVLGAFGCGTFKNPPELVAGVFRIAMEEEITQGIRARECFEKIVFAIRNKTAGENVNYEVFKEILGC